MFDIQNHEEDNNDFGLVCYRDVSIEEPETVITLLLYVIHRSN
jgi:hypothetical protein